MITYRQFYDIFQSSRRLWVMGSAENDGTETVEPNFEAQKRRRLPENGFCIAQLPQRLRSNSLKENVYRFCYAVLKERACTMILIMVALCNRTDHYIFAL